MTRVRFAAVLALLVAPLVTTACGTASYYSQAIAGHLALMRDRESIASLLANDTTDPDLRRQLETLRAARRFAVDALALPDNDSYSTYVETGRQHVTWNVVAAEEFSVAARQWCFPIAGCVNYRGYFDPADARAYAAELVAASYDVTIGGASAYSTLGWFSDPVLDTMLRGDESRWVGTLFHELAHQRLYVAGDSDFNEAFASVVEQEGVRRWLVRRDRPEALAAYRARVARGGEFVALLQSTRERLERLYAEPLAADAMRRRKQAVFDGMRNDYRAMRATWGGYDGYDGWFARDLNNARLVSVATYRRLVPAFEALLAGSEDLPAFYREAEALGELPAAERAERLAALDPGTTVGVIDQAP